MQRWPVSPSECALAAVTTVVMAVDVGQGRHPRVLLALVVVVGLTFAWRLRLPELPLLAVCLLYVYAEATAPGPYGPQTLVIGVMVALYAAAAYTSGRRSLAAGGVSLLLVWLGFVSSAEGNVADFFPFLIWGAPWLVGRLARRQALQAHADGARAAVLLVEQEAQTREAAGRERDRIARELHDVVAHAVSLMVVQAGAERLAHPHSPSQSALAAIETSGRQALVELRNMLGVLRAPAAEGSEPTPDLSALPALVAQVREAGLQVELTTSGTGTLPPGIALSVYRVVQEALTNALRHGDTAATQVRVDVGDTVLVEVRNTLPTAAQATSQGSGRGVIGMRERVALHDGSLDAGPEDGQWVVRARLPLATR